MTHVLWMQVNGPLLGHKTQTRRGQEGRGLSERERDEQKGGRDKRGQRRKSNTKEQLFLSALQRIKTHLVHDIF